MEAAKYPDLPQSIRCQFCLSVNQTLPEHSPREYSAAKTHLYLNIVQFFVVKMAFSLFELAYYLSSDTPRVLPSCSPNPIASL